MATRTEYDIEDHKARAALAPRGSVYWHKLETNHYVGFQRLTESSAGVWKARVQGQRGAGGDAYASLGTLADVPEKNRFNAARKLAQEHFDRVAAQRAVDATKAAANTPENMTLAKVLEAYVLHCAGKHKTGPALSRAADLRFAALVYPFPDPASPGKRWVDKPVARITAAEFTAWKNWMSALPTFSRTNSGKRRTLQTVNRDVVYVRAALNHAHDQHGTPNVWKKALGRNVKLEAELTPKRAKDAYVSKADRLKLLKAAGKVSPAVVPLLQAIMVVPVRPKALAQMSVGNYDAATHTLLIPPDADKANSNRVIGVSSEAAAVLDAAIASADGVAKHPTAPLFTSATGRRWDSSSWGRAIRAAVKEAGLPKTLTMYYMRHTRITDLVRKGDISPMEVAEMAGTSVKIIEDHYFQHSTEVQRKALDRVKAF